MVETHVSVLLFLGDRVLKLRKPVAFDFVDFSTPSARAEDCRREVELNSRLAADVYLGVAQVTLGEEVLEQCVVMRRMPADRCLARIVSSEPEPVWDAELRTVAETLARFHAGARRSDEISSAASGEAMAAHFEADVAATARFVGSVLDPDVHEVVVRAVRRYLAGRGPLFSARARDGYVCDGHGDLQADDIYCLDDGPRILDCLEFDDRLRYGDVAGDVAFLAMDLERLGCPSAAERFVSHYERSSGERIPPTLLHLSTALRAYVRVKVACLRHEQGDPTAAAQAAALLEMARHHLERARVRLVLVGGLPGSGKSTLAAGLGEALGAGVVRSDEVRRASSGTGGDDGGASAFGAGRYAPEATRRVYAALMEAAQRSLGLGESVVLDASWTDAARRVEAQALATRCSADLSELHCVAPAAITERRIVDRLRTADDASEATVAVARAMARSEAPWPTATSVDTTRDPEQVRTEALRVIGVVGDTG